MPSGPFRVSPTQPKTASGANRYEMRPVGGGTDHARAVGGVTLSGIEVRQRSRGTTTWSDWSTNQGSFTTPATAAIAPTVDSVTLSDTSYTTGQTIIASYVISPGNGTSLTRTVEFLRGATVVQTSNPTTNSGTVNWISTGTGTITARVTATSSAGSNNRTSSAATLAAPAVAPVASPPTLDKAAYTTGDVAVATAHYTLGSGSLTSRRFRWYRNAVLQETDNAAADTATFTTTATGTLTVDFTIVTSVGQDTEISAGAVIGTPAPTAPDSNDWAFVATISAPGLTNRFTGRFHFPVGSGVSEAAVTAVQWSYDRANWFATVAMTDWTDGTNTWRMDGTTNEHTVGYSETSSPVYIRIATAGGTSAASASGLTFTAPDPPPPGGSDITKPTASDWSIPSVVEAPGVPNRFTGQIRFEPASAIEDADVTSVEWLGAGNIWLPTRLAGTDGDGQVLYEMQHPEGISHTLGFAESREDIFIRYSTEDGTSEQSTTSKGFVTAAEPAYVDDIGALNFEIGGMRVRRARLKRPSQIVAIVQPTVTGDVLTFVPPPLPLGGVAFMVRYNEVTQTGTTAFTFEYQTGVDELYISAVGNDGTRSVLQIVRFEA